MIRTVCPVLSGTGHRVEHKDRSLQIGSDKTGRRTDGSPAFLRMRDADRQTIERPAADRT